MKKSASSYWSSLGAAEVTLEREGIGAQNRSSRRNERGKRDTMVVTFLEGKRKKREEKRKGKERRGDKKEESREEKIV